MRISALFLLISLLFFYASWLSEAATCSQGYRNLALDGIAKQSSTENETTTAAQKGIDGGSNFSLNGRSVVLTKQELFPFWEVVLPSTSIIYSIIINERTDCCPDLPSDFMVLLYNENCVLVMTHYFVEEPVDSGVWRVDTQGVEARSVVIRLVDNLTPRAITFGEITLCGVDTQKVPMNSRMICSDGTLTEPSAHYTSCSCTCPEPNPKQKGDSSFHLLITPDDVKNISYSNRIRLYESLSAGSSISFDAGSTNNNRLMRLTLVEPNVLKDSARYVVTATVSHRNPVSVTTDMDLTIAVSDNSSTVGYEIADQSNSPTYMWASEGLSEQILNPSTTTFQSDEQNNYSPLHTVQVKFGGGVGAFGIGKTVSGVNRVASHQYSKVLKPANGVYVDIYRNAPPERYIIDFIEVRLEKET